VAWGGLGSELKHMAQEAWLIAFWCLPPQMSTQIKNIMCSVVASYVMVTPRAEELALSILWTWRNSLGFHNVIIVKSWL
jgi:hypothetical protein